MTSSHVLVINWHSAVILVILHFDLWYWKWATIIIITTSNTFFICGLIFSFSGMSKLRFKPAYNPYTEPSMEIFR